MELTALSDKEGSSAEDSTAINIVLEWHFALPFLHYSNPLYVQHISVANIHSIRLTSGLTAVNLCRI